MYGGNKVGPDTVLQSICNKFYNILTFPPLSVILFLTYIGNLSDGA